MDKQPREIQGRASISFPAPDGILDVDQLLEVDPWGEIESFVQENFAQNVLNEFNERIRLNPRFRPPEYQGKKRSPRKTPEKQTGEEQPETGATDHLRADGDPEPRKRRAVRRPRRPTENNKDEKLPEEKDNKENTAPKSKGKRQAKKVASKDENKSANRQRKPRTLVERNTMPLPASNQEQVVEGSSVDNNTQNESTGDSMIRMESALSVNSCKVSSIELVVVAPSVEKNTQNESISDSTESASSVSGYTLSPMKLVDAFSVEENTKNESTNKGKNRRSGVSANSSRKKSPIKPTDAPSVEEHTQNESTNKSKNRRSGVSANSNCKKSPMKPTDAPSVEEHTQNESTNKSKNRRSRVSVSSRSKKSPIKSTDAPSVEGHTQNESTNKSKNRRSGVANNSCNKSPIKPIVDASPVQENIQNESTNKSNNRKSGVSVSSRSKKSPIKPLVDGSSVEENTETASTSRRSVLSVDNCEKSPINTSTPKRSTSKIRNSTETEDATMDYNLSPKNYSIKNGASLKKHREMKVPNNNDNGECAEAKCQAAGKVKREKQRTDNKPKVCEKRGKRNKHRDEKTATTEKKLVGTFEKRLIEHREKKNNRRIRRHEKKAEAAMEKFSHHVIRIVKKMGYLPEDYDNGSKTETETDESCHRCDTSSSSSSEYDSCCSNESCSCCTWSTCSSSLSEYTICSCSDC